MNSLIIDEKKLRKLMIDLNIKTINDLALYSGISKPTIYEYLNGKSPLTTSFLRLCEYLHVSPSEVLIETTDKVTEK